MPADDYHAGAEPVHGTAADLAAAALQYAARGWHVLPCDPQNKHPLIERGLYAATTDAAQIEAWWRQWPFAMIGIRTGSESGIFVLDVDVDADTYSDGFVAIAELEKTHGMLPETLRATTPRGGEHLYFKWYAGVRNSSGRLGDHVDVRGQAGFVIAPPSMRSDRKSYAWREACAAEPAEAPAWLIELLAAPEAPDAPASRFNSNGDAYATAALEAECAAVASAQSGARNTQLNRSAFNLGQLVGGGVLQEGEVISRLFDAANGCGLLEDDGAKAVSATIESGLSAGMQQPRQIPERDRKREAPHTKDKEDTPPPPLPWIDMSDWDTERVPEQQWAVLNRIPLRQCVLFSGEGATGKSTVELHRSAAHVLGKDWLGTMPELGPAIYLDAEDETDVIHRRLAAVTRHYRVTFADLINGGLHIMSLVGHDAVLATVSRSGKVEATTLYKQLLEAAGDIKPKSITIASSERLRRRREQSHPGDAIYRHAQPYRHHCRRIGFADQPPQSHRHQLRHRIVRHHAMAQCRPRAVLHERH